MKNVRQRGWAYVAVAILASACNGEPAAAPPETSATAQAPSSPPASAQSALDALDTRKPVPLVPMMAQHQKQNMRDHLQAVQAITKALAAKDFAGVETAASSIGYSQQEEQMCTHMGAGAPGFTEAALQFHHTADTIAEAARKRDADAVLAALTSTLATCTGCHATYKQQVVDDATWASLTQQAAPSSAMHH